LSKEGSAEEDEGNEKFVSREPVLKRDKQDPDKSDVKENPADNPDDMNDDNSLLKVSRVGSILRGGEGRLVSLVVDRQERLLACHGTDNTLELFLVCSDAEIQRRLARKAKKEKKRTGAEVDPARLVPTVQEQFRRLETLRAGGKIKSISVRLLKKSSFRILLALGNFDLYYEKKEFAWCSVYESLSVSKF
jgi:U3 small nucleolar RNA-associated protein 12